MTGHAVPEPPRVSVSAAEQLAYVLASVRPLAPVTVPLQDAWGLVLAEPLESRTDIPLFDNSSMDGYAVRAADLAVAHDADSRDAISGGAVSHATVSDAAVSAADPAATSAADSAAERSFPIVRDIPAGSTEPFTLPPGAAARIMTGAPLPEGADAVVPVEQTDGGLDRVTFRAAPQPGAFVRRRGDDIRAGDDVLAAGTRLGARQLAAAAGSGHGEVRVHPAPRVAVISTGSELVPPGGPLGRGQIPDSNTTLLAACVREAGGTPVTIPAVRDDEAALRDALAGLEGTVDAYVLSGGVSVGAFDVVKAALRSVDTVRFSAVRMQPGKPQAFGTWTDGCPIFGLPGNPVSAFVSFEVFVRPALRALSGHRETERSRVAGVAASDWSSPSREQFMPVVVENPGETPLRVRPAARGGSGSHLLASLALADGLAVVPEDVAAVRAGDALAVMLIS